MVDSGIVTKITNKEILVVPMIKDACINCANSGCAKQGKPFPVSNPKNLPVEVGSVIRLSVSKVYLSLQGFCSLILPILGAVLGFFLGGKLGQHLNVDISKIESFQAWGVILGLVIISGLVFLFTRKNHHLKQSEIVEIIDAPGQDC